MDKSRFFHSKRPQMNPSSTVLASCLILRHAYVFLERNQCFATGGFGPNEQLLPRDQLREKLGETHNTFETLCGSWATFKLAKYLISFTRDAQYGDWIERLVLNGIGAGIPMTADGRVFYYSDYNLHGGTKRNTDFGWSCCTGTRPQAVADYTDLVYFRDAGTLYVNFFTPSSVVWEQGRESVELTQTTAFPASDEVRLTVAVSRPSEFGIQLRTPGWLAAPIEAKVNGEAANLLVGDRHWAGLRRHWRNGDVISVRLPMKLWVSRLDSRRSTPAAVLHGPVVLAFEAPSAKVLQGLDLTALEQVLKPVAGEPLHYRPAGKPSVVARPFASYGPGQRYFVYLDPEMGRRIPVVGEGDIRNCFGKLNDPGKPALRRLGILPKQLRTSPLFVLGLMYQNGRGVAKDEAEAASWYPKAAEQGDARGQFNLGKMYGLGRGVPKDETQAVAWLRKAADQQYPEAQVGLGLRYQMGLGVAKNYGARRSRTIARPPIADRPSPRSCLASATRGARGPPVTSTTPSPCSARPPIRETQPASSTSAGSTKTAWVCGETGPRPSPGTASPPPRETRWQPRPSAG